MESLTTNIDGAILNLSNFRKLYKHYNDDVFNGELSKLNRVNKFNMTNWHTHGQGSFQNEVRTNPSTLSSDMYAIYSISNGSIVIYGIDNQAEELRRRLGFNNTELLKYIVEEFILDQLYMLNKGNINFNSTSFKQEVNNIYFKHNFLLPIVIADNTLFAVVRF